MRPIRVSFAEVSWRERLILLALLLAVIGAGCAPSPANPTAAEPVAAPVPSKWAGLDVGSRGVKPIAMEFIQTPEGWDFTTDTELESRNTELGTLTDDNAGFDPKRLAATVEAITDLEKALREKHKLPPERVKVVVSSGVFTRFKDKDKAAAARKELTAAVEKAIGRAPDFINEQQEAELAARAIISPNKREGRMMIDIGSGNTKFGWYTGAGFQSFTIDTGTKAFRDAVTKDATVAKLPFSEVAKKYSETAIITPLREKIGKADGFDKVTDVQMLGGAAWATATFTHPGTGKTLRVNLTAADVDKFIELARLKPEEAREKALARIPDAAAKAAAAKELERVQKVFTPEDLQAAAEIVRASFAEAKLANKKVAFFQKGQYAWIAGYLMVAAKLPD